MTMPNGSGSKRADFFPRVLSGFERIVLIVLMALLMVVVCASTLELGWLLLEDLVRSREILLDVEEIFELFGYFLLVLIGVELLSTLKVYVREGVIHVEVVLEVSLTAVAQKVIVLDTARAGALTVIGYAALIVALAGAFWAVRSTRRRYSGPPEPI